MVEPIDATDAYAQQLRELWKAAGEPPTKALIRQAKAQIRPARVTRSSWSDWKNGKSVPSDPDAARWLIEDYLRPLARGTTSGYVAPPARWWEQIRTRAIAERPRGGRPSTSHPSAAVVDSPQLLQVGLIPPQAESFQTREITDRLEHATVEDETVVLCQVLAGTGGVGKTQLAAAYARQARGRVEVLVWADAASASAVIDLYADAAVKLGLCDRELPERAARTFLEWAATTDRPWLIVLDDVHDQASLRSWWPPATTVGTTIVTTRRRDLEPPGLRRQTVAVGIFTTQEALSYVSHRLGQLANDQAELESLIEDLGRLPIALAQAAAFMLQQDFTCAPYRDLLRERLLAHAVPERHELPDGHHLILAATWDLSIEQADQARPKGLARPLLQLASVLDPAGIPIAVLASQPSCEHLSTYLPDLLDHASSPTPPARSWSPGW